MTRNRLYMLRKKAINTKAVESSSFVLSKIYFSQHMNQGKRFAHSEFYLKGLVQNVYTLAC
jgi:deoxyribodipyrimidine photolyase-like uncharacterized protein